MPVVAPWEQIILTWGKWTEGERGYCDVSCLKLFVFSVPQPPTSFTGWRKNIKVYDFQGLSLLNACHFSLIVKQWKEVMLKFDHLKVQLSPVSALQCSKLFETYLETESSMQRHRKFQLEFPSRTVPAVEKIWSSMWKFRATGNMLYQHTGSSGQPEFRNARERIQALRQELVASPII